ncbi:mannosyl-oligosaccharide alpha-1,2-mannosidase [Capronia epimyces CBS 606.96]|uniref:alpha-1,2-Mannosidase n=1 Tax=Capronia epimyces CBS 606.96 TaxID=1182542 RepID=W9YIL2_9EURO|nr:mannosyl-oligosaccharide alpha-1,2-mannosidase [Capronia epimyces CBS 606.96]EXJ89510.1 mannosyl-oligosaccharide alpha-1,2-mannosidase [Capronia epimyces CBS 606.96]
MSLIRRHWLVPAFFLACVIYYLFLYPGDAVLYPSTDRPHSKVHWTKHPERYPVAGYRQFPTGPLERIPRIQYEYESQAESEEARKTRGTRQAAVKEAFIHAWNGYKKYAWGQDEVAPISGLYRSSFGGWGATLVDTMDTLWIMDLKSDFERCVEAVQQIDFTSNDEDTLNVFETTIRYLGGLLAAYDLSGGKYPALLEKAQELGEILYSAFDTPNHMPMARWTWKKSALGGEVEPSTNTLLAELGSLSLEFTRLSQLTGDLKYFDAVQRIAEEMEYAQNGTKIPGLWPTIVNANELKFDYNHFTFGGMADSTYEYLPKQYMMLGGRGDQKYRHMYEEAIEAAKRYLFFRPLVPSDEDILFSGNAALTSMNTIPISNLEPQGQHLACFVSGMVALGAKIFSRPEELAIARRLIDGCVWAYNAMPSGLMPETFHLVPCQVGVVDAPPGQCEWSDDKWYEAISKRHASTPETKQMSAVERGKYTAKQLLIFPGFTDQGDNRYILRPEAIESIFIMYRITGDVKLQDIAWKMFQSIEAATRTPIAHAAVNDVRRANPEKSDRMESFWLAETLKYFYLVFSEPSVVNLDEWVLNTEAHPFQRPTS